MPEEGDLMDCELYFLNPKKGFIDKIHEYILKEGFKEIEPNKATDAWNYEKGDSNLLVYASENAGMYIWIVCDGFLKEDIEKRLSVCPECHSSNLRPSILFCWDNSETKQLCNEGRLDYWSGAYDRMGTRPHSHECMDCGCKWHNSAAMFRWNKIISQGRFLTKED